MARQELDYVGQWLEECIEITGNGTHFVPNSAIWLSYSEWCKENGVTPKHKRSLSMELKRKALKARADGLSTFEIGQQQKNSLGKNQKGIRGMRMA